MPYRIKSGQEVLLIMADGKEKEVQFNRTTDFKKNELVASPLLEHNKSGIPKSDRGVYLWGFDVGAKWSKGNAAIDVQFIYTEDVHQVAFNTDKKSRTITIKGSRTNVYSVVLDKDGIARSCTCPVFRFKRQVCKHMNRAELEGV